MTDAVEFPGPLSVHTDYWDECFSLIKVMATEPNRITLLVELIPGLRIIWSVASDEKGWQSRAAMEFKHAYDALETPNDKMASSIVLPRSIEGGSPGARVMGGIIRYSDHFAETPEGVEINGHIIEVPIGRYRTLMRACSVLIPMVTTNPTLVIVSPHILAAIDELKSYVASEPDVDKITNIMLSIAVSGETDGCPLHEGIDPINPLASIRYIIEIIAAGTSYANKTDYNMVHELVAKGIAAGFGCKKRIV